MCAALRKPAHDFFRAGRRRDRIEFAREKQCRDRRLGRLSMRARYGPSRPFLAGRALLFEAVVAAECSCRHRVSILREIWDVLACTSPTGRNLRRAARRRAPCVQTRRFQPNFDRRRSPIDERALAPAPILPVCTARCGTLRQTIPARPGFWSRGAAGLPAASSPDSTRALEQLAEFNLDDGIGLRARRALATARQQGSPSVLSGARVGLRHRHRWRHDPLHRHCPDAGRMATHVDLRDTRSVRGAVEVDRPVSERAAGPARDRRRRFQSCTASGRVVFSSRCRHAWTAGMLRRFSSMDAVGARLSELRTNERRRLAGAAQIDEDDVALRRMSWKTRLKKRALNDGASPGPPASMKNGSGSLSARAPTARSPTDRPSARPPSGASRFSAHRGAPHSPRRARLRSCKATRQGT